MLYKINMCIHVHMNYRKTAHNMPVMIFVDNLPQKKKKGFLLTCYIGNIEIKQYLATRVNKIGFIVTGAKVMYFSQIVLRLKTCIFLLM